MYKNSNRYKSYNKNLIKREVVIIVEVEQAENIDKKLNRLEERIEVLEDEIFDGRNINIQLAINLGLENKEIKQMIKVSDEEIDCFR